MMKCRTIRIGNRKWLDRMVPVLCLVWTVVGLEACSEDATYRKLLSWERMMEQGVEAVADSLKTMDGADMDTREEALFTYLRVCSRPETDSLQVTELQFERTLRYLEEEGDSARLSRMYWKAASAFYQRFYLVRAQDYYEKGLMYLNEGADPHLAFDLNVGLGRIYRFNRMYEEEDRVLASALEVAERSRDSLLVASANLIQALRLKERGRYAEAMRIMGNARCNIGALPAGERARILLESGLLCLRLNQPDSTLHYLKEAVRADGGQNPVYGILYDGLRCYQAGNDSCWIYFDHMMPHLSLEKRVEAYRYAAGLLNERKERAKAYRFLTEHVVARDSLDHGRKNDLLNKLQAVREYRQQRTRIESVEKRLAGTEVLIYRMLIVAFVLLFVSISYYFFSRFREIKLRRKLMEADHERVRLDLERRENELRYMREREENEKLEMERLNQKVDYYKRLNEITIPVLMQGRTRSGALHFQDSDWEMVRNNTDACFENFTERLKQEFPQLNEEEINFCCLVKMELSIALLSEIYHIAKGSISRKKMRLKEKMGVENQSFDEFIASF